MKFYWKVSQIPELAHLPPSVRRQVWQAAFRKALLRWTTLAAGLVLLLLGKFVVAPLLGMDEALGGAIGAGVGMMLAWQIAANDIRKSSGSTERPSKPKPKETWFIGSVVVSSTILCLGALWLVSGASAPQGEARLEVDMSASKIAVVDAHYVVRGTVVNNGSAAGRTNNLKVTFLKSGVELGSRAYPLRMGPIAPGQRLDFTQRLDEPPIGTTDITPSVDSVTETSLIGAVVSFTRQWRCADGSDKDRQIRACTVIIESGRESPENIANALTNRGITYGQMGQQDRAIQDYDQAIRLKPDHAAAFNCRCYAKASAGRLDEALADCNESLKLRPNDADTLDSRAFTDLKRGHLQESIADFDAALKTRPQLASSLFGRGIARQRLGDVTAGDADMTAALKIDPDIRAKYALRGVTP